MSGYAHSDTCKDGQKTGTNEQKRSEGVRMPIPSNVTALQALLLQAAADGRGEILFGDSLSRAREILPFFMPEGLFPPVEDDLPAP